MTGSPGSRRLDTCRDRVYCQERLIRRKPGLLSGDIWMKHSNFTVTPVIYENRHKEIGIADATTCL